MVEERHFGAWGAIELFKQNGQKADFSQSILPRGFTGHEHFSQITLIHMNGRMYDPLMHRFLSPDNFIQDPYNTQSYDRFAYVWNNPLMNADPSGEIIESILIGALISVLTNGINNTISGRGFFEGAFRAAAIGAISGTISFGIGEAAAGINGTLLSTGISKASAFQFVAHGALGGVMSELNGGKFLHGFISGGVASVAGGIGNKVFGGSFIGTTLSGGFAGGLASAAAGGKFWDGFRNGAISAGLNHAIKHGLQDSKPNWNKLNDSEKIHEILKGLRGAYENGDHYIDLRKIFNNFPKHQISVGTENLYETLSLNGKPIGIYMDVAYVKDMRISIDPGRNSQIHNPGNRTGIWDQMEYVMYRETNMFSSSQGRIMTIQVQNNDYSILRNYIRPKK